MERCCKGCQKPLIRRPQESQKAFDKRVCCNRACANESRRLARAEATPERPYQSRFGLGYVSDAEYLAELMVDRQARRIGRHLPDHYWNVQPWKSEWAMQVRFAKKLLSVYPKEAISRALRSKRGKEAYGLQAPFLVKLFQEEERALRLTQELANADPVKPLVVATKVEAPRPAFVPEKSLLQKLRELDAPQEN